MINEIVFATNNLHKLEEIRQIVGSRLRILSLSDIGCQEDIAETGNTLEENAQIKARFVKDKFGYDCFADDSGLEVDVLNGEPGIYSSRYAGEGCNPQNNMDKLLHNLQEKMNRNARFRTVIALILTIKPIFLKAPFPERLSTKKEAPKGLGTILFLYPKGTIKHLPSWMNGLKTKSAIVRAPQKN